VIEKIREETGELTEALQSGKPDQVEEEIGDLLFCIVNLARLCKVDSEAALRRTNRKFKKRFHAIEKEARKRGMEVDEMSLEEMDNVWDAAKGKS